MPDVSQPVPQPIQPGPAPVTSGVGHMVLPTGEGRVVVRFDTLHGPFHVFLSPEHAETVGQQIIETARKAKTGLHIAHALPPTPSMNGG